VGELFALDVGPRTVDHLRRVLAEFVAGAGLGATIVLHGPAGVVELPGGQAGTRAVLSVVAAGARREGSGCVLVGGALASFVFAHAAELVADGLSALSFDAVAPSSS
jgi:3-phosphoglycerate kinase